MLRITSYNVCYTKLLRDAGFQRDDEIEIVGVRPVGGADRSDHGDHLIDRPDRIRRQLVGLSHVAEHIRACGERVARDAVALHGVDVRNNFV